MTRPHEETWRERDGIVEVHSAENGWWFRGLKGRSVADRAKLAAAAPAMARLLLRMERDVGRCTSCGTIKPINPSISAHKDSCEWFAVMRAAGVVVP